MNWNTSIITFALSLVGTLLLGGCSDAPEPLDAEQLPLVVEGWIENGEHPIVIVTKAADLSRDISSFEEYVQKWCRVSIAVDDGEAEMLTGRINHDYTPSFLFTSKRITGSRGQKYTLKIETDKDTIVATTIIPSREAFIDSVKVERSPSCDTLYQIRAFSSAICQRPDGYYKFFTRVMNKETRFYSSFLGTFEGTTYNSENGFTVSKGIHDTFTGKFTPQYSCGDKVMLKLAVLTPEGFDFWNAYENAVSLGGNLFFPSSKGCPTNLQVLRKGAPQPRGYWLGYSSSLAIAEIAPEGYQD